MENKFVVRVAARVIRVNVPNALNVVERLVLPSNEGIKRPSTVRRIVNVGADHDNLVVLKDTK